MNLSIKEALGRVNNPEKPWPFTGAEFPFFDEIKNQLVELGFSTEGGGPYTIVDTIINRPPGDKLHLNDQIGRTGFNTNEHAPRQVWRQGPPKALVPCRELQIVVDGRDLGRNDAWRTSEREFLKDEPKTKLKELFDEVWVDVGQQFTFTMGSIHQWKSRPSEWDTNLMIYAYEGKKYFRHGVLVENQDGQSHSCHPLHEADQMTLWLSRWLYAHLDDAHKERLIPTNQRTDRLNNIHRPAEL
jgi:hypothetical protein